MTWCTPASTASAILIPQIRGQLPYRIVSQKDRRQRLTIARPVRTLAWLGILVLPVAHAKGRSRHFRRGAARNMPASAADRVSGLTGIPVGGTLALVVRLVLGFFAGMGWFFSQATASQIDQLSRQLPTAAAKVGSIVGQSSVGKILMEHICFTSIKQPSITMLETFLE